MSSNNIIPAESLGQWQSWRFGEIGAQPVPQPEASIAATEAPAEGVSALDMVEEEVVQAAEAVQEEVLPPPAYPTAAELEAIHQEAWQAGFEAGKEEGLQQGQAEGAQQALADAAQQFESYWAPLAELQQAMETQLQQLGAALSAEVLQLAVGFAEQIVSSKIVLDRNAVLPVLQAALDELGHSLLQARVRAHPEDMAVIQAFAQERFAAVSWQWVADEAVARGGCVVDTGSVKLDLTLPPRLAALRQALGLPVHD
ncbi:FliH/SctL family protein [Vogesella sp. DC21W]|uniref:Flagellar assembly protein FliH n=1 Tax=Vogesella aquatica TaxID=2984206 RepID=A0ABT5IU49_9NEIS|nr:FliH/SctL family protein [Vogesella aquatica]MDC7716097.1 FliH/SctL family protein [Vogesella aquatica]